MRDTDYKDAAVAVMVYSIDKDSTIDKIDEMYELTTQHCKPLPLYFLVGNKVDLDAGGQRIVQKADAEEKKEEFGMHDWSETNAHDK